MLHQTRNFVEWAGWRKSWRREHRGVKRKTEREQSRLIDAEIHVYTCIPSGRYSGKDPH